ncbi:hypothetical protein Tco_0268888 [Tanacetum coccineum]
MDLWSIRLLKKMVKFMIRNMQNSLNKKKLQDDCDVQATKIVLQGDDPIACLNKAMAFMSTVMASHCPSTNNQIKISSNPRNQATIQDGRVIVQQVQGRHGQSFVGTETKGNATRSRGNNDASQARVVKCYNYQDEWHMERQCTWPKRLRNSAWFKEKMLLVQAQESGQEMDEEQLAFLADPCVSNGQATQTIIPQNATFQTDNLDATFQTVMISLQQKRSLWLIFLVTIQTSSLSELNEVKMVFNQMEAAVEQCSVDKKYFNIEKKELSLDNDRVLDHIICQVVMNIVMHVDSIPVNDLPINNKCVVHDNHEIERLEQENDHLFELLLSQDIVHICVNSLASRNDCHEIQESFIYEYNKNLVLMAKLAKKEHMVENKKIYEVVVRCSRLENRSANLELKLQHQKESFLNNRSFNNQNAPEILEFFKINKWQAKLDTKDVSIAKLKKHIKNLKGKTMVKNDALPDNTKFIALGMFKLDLEPLSPKEVLVYVIATCPCLKKPSEKLVAVTSLNKNKKVRFVEPATSSRMKSSTSASRSQPSGNTKKNRISRTTSSNQKNKVEDHPRSVKSNSNKMNRVIESVCNANVKHFMLNANSELIYATCNECMFDAIHDLYVLDFVNDINVRSKSKSTKSSKKKNIWKPTSKVFTDIRYRWKPTG